MAITYKPGMTKDELLDIAAAGGVEITETATKKEIIAALEAYNAAEGQTDGGEGNTPAPEEQGAEGAQGATEAEKAESAPKEYGLFVYAGPSIPGGILRENAIFRGSMEDVKAYLAAPLEKYPQIASLIVPANRLAGFAAKVKTPGNIAHKHYCDIVSAMRGNKEV